MSSSRLTKLWIQASAFWKVRSLSRWRHVTSVESNAVLIDGEKVFQTKLAARAPSGSIIIFNGFDERLDLSIAKAVSELLEAFLCWELNIDWMVSRSGTACHRSRNLAIDNAYGELVERDAFIMHLFNPQLLARPIAPYRLPRSGNVVFTSELQSADREIKCVLAATRFSDDAPWTIGLGNSPDLAGARQKAIEECLMINNDWALQEFLQPTRDTERHEVLQRHYRSSLDEVVFRSVMAILEGSGQRLVEFKCSRSKAFVIAERCSWGPLYTVRCQHPDLLNLAFGIKWSELEIETRSKLESRGLNLNQWFFHPLI